jgi:uncharacterized protein YidB (DUF937 family)
MGLLDSMLGQAGGSGNQVLEQIMGLINDGQAGGLAGLVQKFRDGGLDQIVSSWVGTGANLPISPDQLKGILGSDRISQMAGQAGVAPDAMSQHLAGLLPQVIDKLTPNGSLPEGGLASAGLGMLKGLLG